MDIKVKKDPDEASTDGEEDFESADEGEGKEKLSTVSAVAAEGPNYSKGTGNANIEFDTHIQDKASCIIKTQDKTGSDGNVTDLSTHEKMESKDVSKKLSVSSDTPESKCETPIDTHTVNIAKLSSVSLEENLETRPADELSKQESEAKISQFNTPSMVTNEDNLGIKMESTETEAGANSTNSVVNNEAEAVGSGGWGWGAWGSVFTQATASVTSGLSHVIEKVETTLGIPEPGELDEVLPKDEEKDVITTEPKTIEIERGDEYNNKDSSVDSGDDNKAESGSFLSSWGLSSLSNAVTSKGLELVSEGIDALETIGKKTMNVISDGDPGFRSKRNIFQKPTLSQVLRDAKEKSAKEAAERKKQEVLEKVNFNDEFDRYQGLAHLEALEILSRESEGKIESMLIDMFDDDLEKAKTKLRAVQTVFGKDNQDEDSEEKEDVEFAVEIGKCAMALNLAFVPDKLNQTEEAVSKWLEECIKDQENLASSRAPDDIYCHVITSLANITAKSIEVFRKVAEMILLAEMEEETVSAQNRAIHLCRLTKVVTNRISSLSASYARCLNTAVDDTEDNDNITPVITEVYLECSNSSSHVQDALKLLLPVLQASALTDVKKDLK